MSSIQHWRYVVLVYPITYLASIPWSFLLSRYRARLSNAALISLINAVFVETLGYAGFSLVYLGFLFCYTRKDGTIEKQRVVKQVQKYGIATVCYVMINVWCFGAPVFERINSATGGHCDVSGGRNASRGEDNITMHQCRHLINGIWVDGFDASGHVYFLSSASLCILRELLLLGTVQVDWENQTIVVHDTEMAAPRSAAIEDNPIVGDNPVVEDNPVSRWATRLIVISSLTLVSVWYFMFVVTCLFFHSVDEKLVGLIGVLVPYGLSYIE